MICERNINWLPLMVAPTRDQALNLGTCPDQELNQLSFALCYDAPLTEPQQPGQKNY